MNVSLRQKSPPLTVVPGWRTRPDGDGQRNPTCYSPLKVSVGAGVWRRASRQRRSERSSEPRDSEFGSVVAANDCAGLQM